MLQTIEKRGVHLVGFDPMEAQALVDIASSLYWPTTRTPGSLDCISKLSKEPPYLAVVDIDGIEQYGPLFLSAARKAGVRSAFVFTGDTVPKALNDQLTSAGADLVMNKAALFTSQECCSEPRLTRSLIEVCGAEKFVSVEIARKRNELMRGVPRNYSGAERQ